MSRRARRPTTGADPRRRASLGRLPLRERFLFPALGYVFGGLLTLILYIPTLPGMLSTLGGVAETSAVDVMQEYQNPLWTIAEGIRTGIGAAYGRWYQRTTEAALKQLNEAGGIGRANR